MKVPLAIYLLCAIMFGNVESIDFEKARSKAYDLINLIYQRYEFHVFNQYQFFIGSLNMNTKTWDMMKYKFASKIVSQSTFLMTFGGSSVTAGHDNYFNQSFPIVFEHRMKPIFNHLNVDLQVHNIAMGANGCRPSNYCYETQGGDNPDWIQWEQSFNCGKDKGVFELIARVAGWSRAVLFYSASGGYIPTDCKEPAGGAVSWVSEEWTPEKVGIQSKYSANYTHLKSLLNEWYEDTSSAERFAGPLGDKYLVSFLRIIILCLIVFALILSCVCLYY